LFLCEVPQDIRYSSAYFRGNIIDVTHRILRLVRSRWVEREVVKFDLNEFISFVNQWMLHFYKKIDPTSIQHICTQNQSECLDLFSSRVIDLLESIPQCMKDITVNIDSGGWCYIKGQYKMHTKCPLILPDGSSGQQPLTVKQQVELQNVLFGLARFRCHSRHRTIQRYRTDFDDFLFDLCVVFWNTDVHHDMLYGDDVHLTFKVDLKCRKELAPIELLELLKEQSYEDNGNASAPGAHTLQDPSPNLKLKLQIERRYPWRQRRAFVYKYLIGQRHTDRKWRQWLYWIRTLWSCLCIKMRFGSSLNITNVS
jgi:hypothetical protein